MDEVTLTSGSGDGEITRNVNIDLTTRDARGLIVRATPNRSFKTERYINRPFVGIQISGEDNNLSFESDTSPGGSAGVTIPIQIYASTDEINASEGRFTFAPNLEGKTIVVTALGDYNNSGKPKVVLNSIEIKMINGQASGEITITNAMPTATFGAGSIVPTNAQYGTTSDDGGGLGVAFVAYVKEKQSINNYNTDIKSKIKDSTNMDNYTFSVDMIDLNNSSDTIQVRSGEAVELKVGEFVQNATKVSKLWKSTSEIFNVSEGRSKYC
jgi:hypothetical protein